MARVFVLAEHRMGEIRDVTFEMLGKGAEICSEVGAELISVLLGHEVRGLAEELAKYSDKVFLLEDEGLKYFNAELYKLVLSELIPKHKPILTMIGHTGFGVDLAPALAVRLGVPLATDCIDLRFEDGRLKVTRQMYGGKVNVDGYLAESDSYIVTVRPATFEPGEPRTEVGEIIELELPRREETVRREFVKYVEPPKAEVDITAADIIVSVGRGIKDAKNIPMVEELAKELGGVLACSRPIVDKGWLPKERQVGSSGKTVRPKLYLALGISGAFQHVVGMKDSELVIAVNKDPRAPIFGVADYGVAEDLFKIVPELTRRIRELKGK